MIKILDGNLVRVAAIKNVLDATRLEELNGENTLDFSAIFDGRVSEFVSENTIYEIDDDYFDTAVFKKSVDDDGMITVDVETEHISYRLNKPEYNVEYFTEIGLPSYILGKILEGTGFTVGTIEFTTSITYSAKEAKSRRQLLMELVAYVGGEVDFNKFEVNILAHRGSTEIETVIKDRNVKVVSKTVNKRQKDKDGNDLVSYICTPMFIPGDSYALGDNIALVHNQIGLVEQLRVVRISYNPYDEKQTALQFANYINGLENSLFRIDTNTIAKGKLYYGARISPEMGFESIRSDLKARTVMNADTFAMQVGDGEGNWTSKLYFDPESNMYIFDGTLSAAAIEAIKAEIDIVISNTTITNVISAQKGNIAELTVDQIDTSDMVQKYLNSDKGPVGYWRGFDQFIEFVKAEYAGDISSTPGPYQAWTGYPDSPVLTEDYPNQIICRSYSDGNTVLFCIPTTAGKLYTSVFTTQYKRMDMEHPTLAPLYKLTNGTWEFWLNLNNIAWYEDDLYENNVDVYDSIAFSQLYKSKTTTDEQGGDNKVQVSNRTGDPLYWLDAEHIGTGITTDATSYPVWRYVYNGEDGLGLVALKIFHEVDPVNGFSFPKMVWGAGNPAGRQKGYIYKDSDEMVIAYENAAGEMREIRLGEDGVFITPYNLENITFSATGFDATYSGETYTWTWTKDVAGKITQLAIDGRTIPVTWPA